MRLAVIGGKLQGVEAVYLAQKAGWRTLVIDKDPHAPATGLCDRFLEFEFGPDGTGPQDCPRVDLILPAVEDDEVLLAVKNWAEMENIPLAFDLEAYGLSCSKQKSDALFRKMNLPVPGSWPECGFPVVVKPDQASGSKGVEVFHDSKAFDFRFPPGQCQGNMVLQAYIEGPSYSIEVLGLPGKYQTLQVTDLGMDNAYDCKRVSAPSQLPAFQIERFEEMALAIAEELCLTGIMDIEVILNGNELKLLEIDARLPSQTPMTVYGSTGVNMVEMMGLLFLNKPLPDPGQKWKRCVVVEHLHVSGADFEILGEHIMAQDGPLTLQPDFFGADEAITSYVPGKKQWVATLIFCGDSCADVAAKRKKCYHLICESFNLVQEDKTH